MLTTSLAAVVLSAGLGGLGSAPAQAAPADTQTGSASGSAEMLLAWPLGFVLFGACFADGDSPTHNPLCQALLDLTAGSTGR
ncbi:hypothetical protein [Nocardia sp. NPDC058497]|uniref:hypothetical protein n=1 Tax=Nocardia sp. NPDC058497 TaxID=3346529 RepID=UPI003661C0FA